MPPTVNSLIKKASKEISKNSRNSGNGPLDQYNLFNFQEESNSDDDEENI